MRRSPILAFFERQHLRVAPPDTNPWVQAMARTLTGVVGWVITLFALGLGGVSGDWLATHWHGPANSVWPIYASVGGLLCAALAAQIMLFLLCLTDRRRIHYMVLLLGLIPGVGLVILAFVGTNWFLTRSLDRVAQPKSQPVDAPSMGQSDHDVHRG